MPQGNVRPSESACGRPTPPPLGCVRSRERRAWPASAHVWDRTARSGTCLLCPCITIGVAVVRVCATGFQPPWGPWPLRHVRRRMGCLRSVANVLEPVVWTTPQPSLGRNVVRMSQVLPSQGSANGWPSGYRHLDATHILGPVVLRCARVSPAAPCVSYVVLLAAPRRSDDLLEFFGWPAWVLYEYGPAVLRVPGWIPGPPTPPGAHRAGTSGY